MARAAAAPGRSGLAGGPDGAGAALGQPSLREPGRAGRQDGDDGHALELQGRGRRLEPRRGARARGRVARAARRRGLLARCRVVARPLERAGVRADGGARARRRGGGGHRRERVGLRQPRVARRPQVGDAAPIHEHRAGQADQLARAARQRAHSGDVGASAARADVAHRDGQHVGARRGGEDEVEGRGHAGADPAAARGVRGERDRAAGDAHARREAGPAGPDLARRHGGGAAAAAQPYGLRGLGDAGGRLLGVLGSRAMARGADGGGGAHVPVDASGSTHGGFSDQIGGRSDARHGPWYNRGMHGGAVSDACSVVVFDAALCL